MTRWRAAGIHLLLSALLGVCVLALLFFVWYPGPLFRATGGEKLLLLIVGILMGLLTAFLPGYFISLPFRLLGWDAWVNTIQNFFAVIMLIVIAVQATFGVHKTAREMHRLWANRQQTR